MMIGIGLFGLYSAFAKAGQLWAKRPNKVSPVSHAVTRSVRCLLALILIALGYFIIFGAIGMELGLRSITPVVGANATWFALRAHGGQAARVPWVPCATRTALKTL